MGLYSVSTDSNVPNILKYGRTEANFIHVTDTKGRRLLLNVRSIVSVREVEGPSSDNAIGDAVGSLLDSVFGLPSSEEDEKIITIDQEED